VTVTSCNPPSASLLLSLAAAPAAVATRMCAVQASINDTAMDTLILGWAALNRSKGMLTP
jgi:hypothetical protein